MPTVRIGVDEAGKGPVIGSMFAVAVRAPESSLPDDLRESKQLTPARREELAAELRAIDQLSIGQARIDPSQIDRPGTDMNELTVTAHANAIAAVVVSGDRIQLDAADVDAERFGHRVHEHLTSDVQIEAAHKADESSPVVAAASVLAKVARDAHITELSEQYGEIGSGYPSDPTTQQFLKSFVEETGGLPPCARSTWATAKRAIEAAEQSRIDSY